MPHTSKVDVKERRDILEKWILDKNDI